MAEIARGEKGVGATRAACATRAANAVDVVLAPLREVVVNDDGDVLNIYPGVTWRQRGGMESCSKVRVEGS